MNAVLKSAVAIALAAMATQAAAQIVFYENNNFSGRTFTTENEVRNFQKYGFNDRASSVIVMNERWEVCDDAQFGGRCIVLRPGRYPALSAMGMNDRISSTRMVSQDMRVDPYRYAPAPAPIYNNYRRNNESLHEARVTSVHAVVGPPDRRCWIEHQQVTEERSKPNVGGAVVGALLGGVLGHQIGSGRGNDLATAGGAVAGAVVGSNVGRDGGGQTRTQDIQRCSETPSQARPEYWDVTYEFRGIEHRIQVTSPPGRTITVNEQGEPRA